MAKADLDASVGAESTTGEARAALARAAADLFASRGPANVSVREVAEHAGVNHGLVHYYFGSKEGLIAAALDHCVTEVASDVGVPEDPALLYRPGSATERHGRFLAQLILEGRDPAQLQGEFPAVTQLVEHLRRRGSSDREARERAAQVAALVLGWHLFEPFLAAAAGLDLSDRRRVDLLHAAVTRLLA